MCHLSAWTKIDAFQCPGGQLAGVQALWHSNIGLAAKDSQIKEESPSFHSLIGGICVGFVVEGRRLETVEMKRRSAFIVIGENT